MRQWFHPQASSQLPSWVFDFTHCNVDVNENGHESRMNLLMDAESDASAKSSFRIVRCNRTSVHVAGFIFDESLDIGDPIDSLVHPVVRAMKQVVSLLRLIKIHLLPLMPSVQVRKSHTRAFIRTLSSGRGARVGFTAMNDLHPSDSVHWEDNVLEDFADLSRQDSVIRVGRNWDGQMEMLGFMQSVGRNTNHAKFFITKSLRTGSAAPLDAAVGDRIAILASGVAPFVLRPVSVDYAGEEAYRIIGGCYVEGISA